MSIIRVTPDELESVAMQYNVESSTVEEVIGRLRDLNGKLSDVWEGESQRAFADQYEELEPSFQQMVKLLHEVHRQLLDTASALRSADSEIASQIRG